MSSTNILCILSANLQIVDEHLDGNSSKISKKEKKLATKCWGKILTNLAVRSPHIRFLWLTEYKIRLENIC